MTYTIVTFYKFIELPDYASRRAPILSLCQEQGIRGTILLAREGINGTIAGLGNNIAQVLSFLRSDSRLADLQVREAHSDNPPFKRMKVKLKKEIVTLGQACANPLQQVGTYVSPRKWNELITQPDVLVIDTRNSYEVAIGTFRGAINPHTRSFRQFPNYVKENLAPDKQQKIAMFCTGGIRCEKASSYLLSQGFKQVYHLKGGILKYLEEIPPEESLWEGECFVFDERVAVTNGLEIGHYEMCLGCGHPISEADKHSPQYQQGISCPHCRI